jgi:hypothetical protein
VEARSAARHYRTRHGLESLGESHAQIVHDEQENTLTVSSTAARIKSLDDLLVACKVDLTVWQVERYVVNKWEVGAKVAEKNLEWASGVISGTLKSSGGLTVEPLFQVKAWLVRRDPIPIHPTIQPIQLKGGYKPAPPPPERPFVRALVWGDPQFGFRRRVNDAKLTPFHDRRVLDIVLQIAQVAKVNQMSIVGDWFDASEFTDKFLKSPEFYFTFQPALLESFWWLRQYREIVSDIRLHEGNHDRRIPDSIKRHLPFAYGLRPAYAGQIDEPSVMSVPSLLGLDVLNIQWIDKYPEDRDWLADNLVLNHGNTVRGRPLEHIHRQEMSTSVRASAAGQYTVKGFSPGCACHIDHRVPGHNHNQTWTQGLGIVDVFDFERFSITPIAVDNGVAVYDGKLFEARDRVPELREALGEWNW